MVGARVDDPQDTRARARIGTAVIFLANGTAIGGWAAGIPVLRAALSLSPAALGLGLLSFAAGSILSMLAAGWVAARLGNHRCSLALGLMLAPLLALPGLAAPLHAGLAGLIAAGLALGSCNGGMDVAMNAHATEVEAACGRPVMSSFHAGFSLGGLLGAVAAGTLAWAGVGDIGCRLVVGGLVAALILAAGAIDPAWHRPPDARGRAAAASALVLPGAALLGIGGLAFLSFMTEGAIADWSGVYLATEAGATAAGAAAGFATFSVAMALGRVTGDRVVRALGPARVLGLGGGLAAAGLLLALVPGGRGLGVAGFALAGIGLANVVPVLFSAAGRATPTAPSMGVAAAATLGYAGFLCGPPLIGLVAQAAGLRAALLLLPLACVLVAGLRARAVAEAVPGRRVRA